MYARALSCISYDHHGDDDQYRHDHRHHHSYGSGKVLGKVSVPTTRLEPTEVLTKFQSLLNRLQSAAVLRRIAAEIDRLKTNSGDGGDPSETGEKSAQARALRTAVLAVRRVFNDHQDQYPDDEKWHYRIWSRVRELLRDAC